MNCKSACFNLSIFWIFALHLLVHGMPLPPFQNGGGAMGLPFRKLGWMRQIHPTIRSAFNHGVSTGFTTVASSAAASLNPTDQLHYQRIREAVQKSLRRSRILRAKWKQSRDESNARDVAKSAASASASQKKDPQFHHLSAPKDSSSSTLNFQLSSNEEPAVSLVSMQPGSKPVQSNLVKANKAENRIPRQKLTLAHPTAESVTGHRATLLALPRLKPDDFRSILTAYPLSKSIIEDAFSKLEIRSIEEVNVLARDIRTVGELIHSNDPGMWRKVRDNYFQMQYILAQKSMEMTAR